METRKQLLKPQNRNVNPMKIFTIILLFCFSSQFALGQTGKRKIGKVKSFYQSLSIKGIRGLGGLSSQRTLPASDTDLHITINVNKAYDGEEIIIGNVNESKSSTVYFHFKNGEVEGKAILPMEKKAYSYTTDTNGNVFVEAIDINKVICIGYEKTGETQIQGISQAPPATSPVYNLQSLPGATAVVKLDFDGEYVTNTSWNGGNPIDAQPYNVTEEQIIEIWKMISEDFSAFNLNITTSEAVFQAAQPNRRTKCIFTPTNFYSPNFGGVAHIGSFPHTNYSPCWVFNSGVKYGGEAGSHEIGHTLGLTHDGRSNPQETYYSGTSVWAPIMGTGYYSNLVQWSKGEYDFANNQQDDIAIIAGATNAVGFKPDEAGNTEANAKPLIYSATGEVIDSQNLGIISMRTDVDVYVFNSPGGSTVLNVNPAAAFPDLDILLTLKDSNGTTVATANPPATLSAEIDTSLATGTYYLFIDGTGSGNPATNGYSDYSSIGQYSISGSLQPGNMPPSVSISSPLNNTHFTASANIPIIADATDPEGAIAKVEFYQGSTKLGEDTTSPVFSWDWTSVPTGNYDLTVKAYDQAGLSAVSEPITVVVEGTPPSVSFIAPANNTHYAAPASFELSVSATDLEGPIAKVEFYLDSIKLGEDTHYPGFSWNMTNLIAGTYIFTAKAFDEQGLSTVSEPITVVVEGNVPPSVSFIYPENNAYFTAPASFELSASATDLEGPIAKVEFYQDSIKLGEDTHYPGFSWHVSNLSAGTYSYTAKAFDQEGVSSVSEPITVTVYASCALDEPTPPATQYIVRNFWWDQASGSFASNESGALKVVHRPYGQDELWVIETGKTMNITNGQTYNIKFDFKDYQAVGVTGIDLGFAQGLNAPANGPQLVQPVVTAPAGYSSANFTTKSLNITAAYTGAVNLAFRLRWNGQPTSQVTDYIKNITVCTGAGSLLRRADFKDGDMQVLSSLSATEGQSMIISPNPSESAFSLSTTKAIDFICITDAHGKQVYSMSNVSKGVSLQFGRDFTTGMYFASVIYADGTSKTYKIVKTR